MEGVPLCIIPIEAAIIIRRSNRTAERILNDIRFLLLKKTHQLVTIKEFCDHMGLVYEEVIQHYYTPRFDLKVWL